jgi:hypothetical protein
MLTVTRQGLVASAAVTADRPRSHPGRPPSYDKKVGLVLQGGGALGSYQAGVYEALASSEYLPDWVAGISIGAINAAIIAGNPLENRLERLRSFWDEITAPTSLWPCAPAGSWAIWQQKAGALTALMFGQPGLFTPRTWLDWFAPCNLVSYYDTSVLKGTLERLVDFYVLDYSPRRSRLTFQVDMFQAGGQLPTNLDEVAEREKDIRYSSRTQICSNAFRDRHEVRHAVNELHKLLPPDLASTVQAKRLYEHGCVTEMDIVQLVYRPAAPQGASKDYDFSRSSMHRLWQQGAFAAETVLRASPWLAPKPRELGVRVFDLPCTIMPHSQ